jgi:hypothetical protein
MDEAFSPIPPDWIQSAIHAREFTCPHCRATCTVAHQVWINRRSPVYSEDRQRKWQEFYQCQCQCVWWAWSSDRPPSRFQLRENVASAQSEGL